MKKQVFNTEPELTESLNEATAYSSGAPLIGNLIHCEPYCDRP